MAVKTTVTRKKTDTPKLKTTAALREEKAIVVETTAPTKKKCFYCENKKEPTYTDIAVLRKYVSDRARINSRQRTGACSKHQRSITKQVKYARHLSMLPFVNRV